MYVQTKCYLCRTKAPDSDICPKCGSLLTNSARNAWRDRRAKFRSRERIKYDKALIAKKTGFLKPNITKLTNNRAVDRLTKALQHRDEHIRELAARALAELDCWDELSSVEKVTKCVACDACGLQPPFTNDSPEDWHDVAERGWFYSTFMQVAHPLNLKELEHYSSELHDYAIPEKIHFLCPGCFEEAARIDDGKSQKIREEAAEQAAMKWQRKRSVISLLKHGPDGPGQKKSKSVFQWLKNHEGKRAYVSYATNFSHNLARSSECTLEAPEVPVGELHLVYRFPGRTFTLPSGRILKVKPIRKNKLVVTLYHNCGLSGDDLTKWKDMDRYDFKRTPNETYEIRILGDK